jgi:hypothetical protein
LTNITADETDTALVLQKNLSHNIEESPPTPVYWSALAIKVGPLAGLNKTGPVERMLAVGACQHLELHLTQCLAPSLTGLQGFVTPDHGVSMAKELVAQRW